VFKASLLTAFSVGLLFQANSAEAAKFRLQGASYSDNGSFTIAAGTYKITGEFSVLTDYRDASGTVVNMAGNSLQSWNIVIRNSADTLVNRFSKGYSSALMGGFADNSTSVSANTSGFVITCSPSSPGGCHGGGLDELTINFGSSFNSFIGDSVGGSANSSSIGNNSISWKNTSFGGVTQTSTAVTAQADFVPYFPAFISFLPLVRVFSRLRRSASTF
jgi:hypothetical protein